MPTRNRVIGSDFRKSGIFFAAARGREATARGEWTSAQIPKHIWRKASYGLQFRLHARVQARQRVEKPYRVRMCGPCVQLVHACRLHDVSGIHDGDRVGKTGNNSEVV